MFVWLLNTPLINYHSVLTLKSMVSFKLLPFDFSLGSQSWLKQYTAKQKMISEDIITDTVKRICRNFNSFNFQQFSIFITGNIEYLQVLVLQRKFCQLQVNSLVMASLCIYYKLQTNLARCDLSTHRSCQTVNLRRKVLFSMFWSAAMIGLKQQGKEINSIACYENSSDMRFLRADRLCFNHDLFSCAMVLLIIFLLKTRANFIHVNITFVYTTELTSILRMCT